jgi:hypothetical protein
VSDDPLSSGWFYVKSEGPGGPVGPLGWAELWGLARAGVLVPGDSVWHQSFPDWLPAGQLEELFPGARPPTVEVPSAISSSPASSAPSAPAGTGGRRSARLPWLIPLVALLLVGLGLGLFFGLRGGGDNRDSSASATDGSTIAPTTSTIASTPESVSAGEPGTWLVMMYEDADDEILEEDIAFDLNEAELVGSTDQVTIVAQMDRYVGGYDGDGDVTSTKRYLVTQDDDIYAVNSEELADLGEVDMGAGQTLYDFATWAIRTYPADHYVLTLADHGGGWTGGWSDNDPEESSMLTMQEIDATLSAIVADTGIGAFELVGFDACLMGQLEVMSAIAPHAAYAVGSAEIEPALGWAYAGFLRPLTENPAMTGRELGQAIVDAYIAQDIRITDDQARNVLTGGDYTIESVIAEMSRDVTMAAVELGAIQDLLAAVNELAVALTETDQDRVAQARAYSQAYHRVFGEGYPPSFIDLGHFADLLIEDVDDPAVAQAAAEVKSALEQAVVAEYHGEDRPASTGLSVYFPNSQEYLGTFSEWRDKYSASIGRFATASLWDDYLTFHYTGQTFDPALADLSMVTPSQAAQTDFAAAVEESAPADGAEIVAPGAGQLAIAPLSVSATEIGSEGTVTLSTEITGSNLAYVYYYVSYYWESDGSYLTADAGYVEPGYTKQVNGVYYPDWGNEDVISVEYEWEPTLYFMSDGNEENDHFAFFNPTVYGADTGEDIYTVRGTYTFVDSGTQLDAEIDFDGDGDMRNVWGFVTSDDGSAAGTWYEIVPRPGDTFTITVQYLEFDENPEGEFVDYLGGTMTFGDTPFTMVPYYAYSGDYALGIAAEDLDGNMIWEFAEVTVTE